MEGKKKRESECETDRASKRLHVLVEEYPSSPLLLVPPEILCSCIVLSFLSLSDFRSLLVLSKYFYETLESPWFVFPLLCKFQYGNAPHPFYRLWLWKRLYTREFPDNRTCGSESNFCWKSLLSRRMLDRKPMCMEGGNLSRSECFPAVQVPSMVRILLSSKS